MSLAVSIPSISSTSPSAAAVVAVVVAVVVVVVVVVIVSSIHTSPRKCTRLLTHPRTSDDGA